MAYKHLSSEERHYIQTEREKGTSQNKTAAALGRVQGSLSRELGRNTGKRGYRYKQAHQMAQQRHKDKPKAVKLTPDIKERIGRDIRADWSPEQVCGRLTHEGVIELHHETIDPYVSGDKANGGTLYKHLRQQRKTYRKRYSCVHNRTAIADRAGIEERSEDVNKREQVGDWEADTVIGKKHKGAIVTLDERKTKPRLALPLRSKKADAVKQAMIDVMEPLEKCVKTITYDHGKEFVGHTAVNKALKCESYFATPYHSWEREGKMKMGMGYSDSTSPNPWGWIKSPKQR